MNKQTQVYRGFIVDSPGYGYTYAPVKVKNQFKKLMAGYLSHGVRISMVMVLINANTGLKGSDKVFLDQLAFYNKPTQIVFSKVDKVIGGRTQLATNLERTSREIMKYKNVYPEIYLLSSKHMFGIEQLRARILTHF